MTNRAKQLLRRVLSGLLIVGVSGIAQNCTRVVNEPVPTQAAVISDPVDEELMKQIETIPSSAYKLEDLLLPDGDLVFDFLRKTNPSFLRKQLNGGRLMAIGQKESKKMLIAKMMTVAYKLCDRTIKHDKGSRNIEPEQHGLAYSWGQRDYSIRAFPPSGGCRMYSVYGLDCSGFVYNVLRESDYNPGLPIDVDRIVKKDLLFWTSLFKSNSDLAQVKVRSMGKIAPSQLQPGDFIYWFDTKTLREKHVEDPSHIGIVLLDKSGQKAIFQSNGTADPAKHCETNYMSGRGCRQISVDKLMTTAYGTYGGVIRLITDITGKWEMQLKCDWADPTDIAAKFTIEFKMSENDDAVAGKGTGFDYDGTPMTVEFRGSFDQARNVLKGRFYMSFPNSQVRQDDLSTTLTDDTGFVNLTSIVRDANSCNGQARLIKLSTSGGRSNSETVRLTRQNLF